MAFNGKETLIEVGDVGLTPGTDITGIFKNLEGSIRINDKTNTCFDDRTIAYNDGNLFAFLFIALN